MISNEITRSKAGEKGKSRAILGYLLVPAEDD